MTVSTGAAATAIVLLVALATWQYKAAEDARGQITILQHQLSDKKALELSASKKACSDRSQRYFTSLGYDEGKIEDNMSTTFQNHYSERFGRCLMTIESTNWKNRQQVVTKSLMDADERKTFGEYAWVSSDTKKYYEQKPMSCTMSPPEKPESYCHATDEYDNYVKEMLSS